MEFTRPSHSYVRKAFSVSAKGVLSQQLLYLHIDVAAGPVSRILSAGLLERDGHSSGPRIAVRLKRPTRRFDAPSRHVFATEAADFLPIWSCSVWGLPCPLHYCRGGALLPHLFTLTPALPPGRYVFCGTFRPSGLNLTSRTLSGTLLCGVRTFLSPRPKTREATVRSGCLRDHYIGYVGKTDGIVRTHSVFVVFFLTSNCITV